jgi:GNAT superfamily N-acetyltransferase
VTEVLDPADVAIITGGLRAHDLNQTGYHDFRPLALFVRDPQTGKVVGGLYGRSEFGLVCVAWFFLPEDWRRARIGSRVFAMAEEEGRRRGCTRIALTTLTGLRCRSDDRLRAARPHALLDDEEARC